MKEVLSWIKDIVIAVLIAVILLFFFKPIVVRQTSMEPNFHNGDYVILSRQAYKLFGEPERGDVIVFKSDIVQDEEKGTSKNLIKRVVGLPGDIVAIEDGYVYINGELLDEDYVIEEGASGWLNACEVPEGCYFVMGDNRPVSLDSRSDEVGFVSADSIMGRVIVRLYPFNSIQTF